MNEGQQQVSKILREHGFEHFGFTRLSRPTSLAFYEEWLNSGFHGDMEYLRRHIPKKGDPQLLLPQAQSAIVLTQDYMPFPEKTLPIQSLRVALYARGKDYHQWLQEKINAVAEELGQRFPNERFVAYTDSAPVLERDLAARAGLGWIGKNGCLIHTKRGSLFFIAEIYTTLNLQAVEVIHPDRCGTCRRCLDICPTQAIVEPRKVDARKCISYLTIETREPAAESLRAGLGDWFFGCDLCQTVCPWNEKAFGREAMRRERDPQGDRALLIKEMDWLLTASDEELKLHFQETPLWRRRTYGLRRNALMIIGNLKIIELENRVHPYLSDQRLCDLARWVLKQLSAGCVDKDHVSSHN